MNFAYQAVMRRVGTALAALLVSAALFSGCSWRKDTKVYHESDYRAIDKAHQDVGKNVVGARNSIRRTRTLAETIDYKLMRAQESK